MIDDTSEKLGLVLQENTASQEFLPQIQKNEVHLWCLPLDLNERQSEIALSLISDHQKDKYYRRKTSALRCAYLGGRYYLLHLLAAYTSLPVAQVELAYSRLNKPYLEPNPHAIEFNFTDTFIKQQAIGIYAFGHQQKLGVDVECLDRNAQFQRVLERRFSPAEQAYVKASDAGQRQRFLRIWTRKEAYGKAKGVGINFSMKELDLFSESHDLAFQCEHNRDWQLLQVHPHSRAIACVVRESHEPFRCRLFTHFSA